MGINLPIYEKVIPDLTFDGSVNLSSPQATFTVKARNNPGADFDNTQSGTSIRTQSTPLKPLQSN